MIIKLFIISIVLTLLFIISYYFYKNFWLLYKQYGYKLEIQNEINTDPLYVRIYYDPTTMPSLYQAYDFLMQSPNALSFVCWQRIPEFMNNIDSKRNTIFFNHKNMCVWHPLDISPIEDYYKQHPNTKFIIHSSNNWLDRIAPLFNTIPSDAIEEIHLYEDCAFFMYISVDKNHENRISKIRNEILGNNKVYFHARGVKRLNSLDYLFDKASLRAKETHKNDIMTEASIMLLKQNLNKTPDITEEYFNIFGFDYKKYRKQLQRPFGIFTFNRYWNNSYANKQISFMYELIDGKLKYLTGKHNIKWLYKEHPRLYDEPRFRDIIQSQRPELESIDRNIPIELFILADIMPDYIAGYYSSLYFNIPAKRIALYIKHHEDPYIPIFKRFHSIPPGRMFELEDIDNNKKISASKLTVKLLGIFY